MSQFYILEGSILTNAEILQGKFLRQFLKTIKPFFYQIKDILMLLFS